MAAVDLVRTLLPHLSSRITRSLVETSDSAAVFRAISPLNPDGTRELPVDLLSLIIENVVFDVTGQLFSAAAQGIRKGNGCDMVYSSVKAARERRQQLLTRGLFCHPSALKHSFRTFYDPISQAKDIHVRKQPPSSQIVQRMCAVGVAGSISMTDTTVGMVLQKYNELMLMV